MKERRESRLGDISVPKEKKPGQKAREGGTKWYSKRGRTPPAQNRGRHHMD